MRVMFNEDWIHFFWTRYENNMDVTEKTLRDFIYQYKDTAITDFSMNVNGTVSSFPSNVLESFTDKYKHEEENGYRVDYKRSFAKAAYDIFIAKGLDMYRVWIDALHEIGRKAWISFRMNDCHANLENFNVRKNSDIEKHRAFWRQYYREPDYFGKCLNYADEHVRALVYSYLDDCPNYWERLNCRLPIVFAENNGSFFETIRIATGDLSGDSVLLQLGCGEKLTADDFEIYVNGKAVKTAEAIPDYNIYKKNWYAFWVEPESCTGHLTAEIRAQKACKLEYAEIYAKPAE